MEHPIPEFYGELSCRNAKNPAFEKAGLIFVTKAGGVFPA
jgi:hypothetical protein